ncbi:tetratricopeptide repeat protein [Pelomonas sp. UHG3]|uniref:Tetratricopeptide repeat protein n=1 Tax=Roseateles hydrophilus TaxID=2975054 RepID=A0ACC6CC91_9BURK|nr:tetratricopeptide repeat protein [Pelomonas sp. UHG3]MCY4746035.1 tetratricopeptide repeat protein [Pelomonas sp. UHG3]
MLSSPIADLLTQGLRALSHGQAAQAEALLREVLRHAPGTPPALAGLGQIAAQAQRWPEAEQAFRGALAGDVEQPRVWYALAQVLEVQGRPGDAAHAFAQAADRQPGWAAPRYQLARLLRALGRATDALGVAEQALQQAPDDVDTLQLLAMLQEELGQLPAAERSLRAALARAPQRAALHHNLGVVLHRQGQLAAALAAHEQAHDLGLDVPDAHYNHGNTLQALGRVDEALDAYRRVLARDPQHALGLLDLTRLRWALGHAEFDAELRHAQSHTPDSDLAPGLHGQLLLAAGRPDEALQAYAHAARLAPQRASHLAGQARALSQLGRHDEACAAHAQALVLAPDDAIVLTQAAHSHFAAGRVNEGQALAQRALAHTPHDQLALALQGLGWRLTQDPRSAWLHDLDELVAVIDLVPPPGWSDIASFNASLAAELSELHTAREAPIDQTLRQGTQTHGQLFDLALPAVQALRSQVARAIDAWLATRREDAAHPLLGRRTAGWRFAGSWSSRLRRGGFHTSHVHGQGWLSSCYYVQTPPSALASATQQGWLQFGEPDLPEPLRAQLPPWRFEAPLPGRLLLFPSYLWHGTRPFDDEMARLTVAFDILPTPAA